MISYVGALFLLLTVAASARGQQFQAIEPVTDICLGCICEAASNCNRTLNCQGDVCGLFKITHPYWVDANKPTLPLDDPNAPGAFQRCVNDAVCAAQAVKNYMSRFAQDCNRDGAVNCLDYAAIHRLGGYGCSGLIEGEYWNRFYNCQTQFANQDPQLDIRGGAPPPE